jgi:hypothetical protein
MEDNKKLKDLLPKDLLKEVENDCNDDLSASFSNENKEIFDAPSSEDVENLETVRFIIEIID